MRNQRVPAPSFRKRSSTSPAASAVGRANRRTNTIPERILCKALRKEGASFRVNQKSLPGCPDVVFRDYRTTIFVDGDFWHGRHWRNRKAKLAVGANADYWISKIEGNRKRDRTVRGRLKGLGWRVIRVWESEIRRDAGGVARRILDGIHRAGIK